MMEGVEFPASEYPREHVEEFLDLQKTMVRPVSGWQWTFTPRLDRGKIVCSNMEAWMWCHGWFAGREVQP